MQVALAPQYFPADGVSGPITVHTGTDLDLLLRYRGVLLREAAVRRAEGLPDPVAALIVGADEARLVQLLDVLGSDEGRTR